jgi:hypothetical protein
VIGCKADGIWSAIKAGCIMAGARTLVGALVPLRGPAPTNFNFVSADYNRVTGLKGDGATKHLNSNRAGNADPQNNNHIAIDATETGAGISIGHRVFGGVGDTSMQFAGASGWPFRSRISQFFSSATGSRDLTGATDFVGISRGNASAFISRAYGANETISSGTAAPESHSYGVFCRLEALNVPSSYFNGRLRFYSIGEDIDLAALETRVTTLMTAIEDALT